MNKKYILPLVFIFISIFGIVATVYIVRNQQTLDIRDEAAIPVESAIITDHTCTDLSQISTEQIEKAKNELFITYGHTSHGSQIISGIDVLMNDNDLYDYFNDHSYYRFGGENPIAPDGDISLWDSVPGGDLGNPDRTTWEALTREVLLNSNSDYSIYPHLRNVVMWSWCGQVSSATEADIDTYLMLMNQLEIDFPDVIFVYMTGHLDGTGEDGNLNVRNNQIRDYCETNSKVLFDFADIESYDPDGNYYLDRNADDGCNYNGGNWADEWCTANPGQCSSCSCAHSHSLNCDQKAKAFWWMMTQLSDLDPVPVQTGCTSDNDCSSPTPYCDTSNGDCVECLDAANCADGESCKNGSCECSGCYDNNTCHDGTSDEFCGINGSDCIICNENQSCHNGSCLTTSCSDDEDCDPGCNGYRRLSYFCDNGNCIYGENLVCDEKCNAGCEIDDDCNENEICNTETCSCENVYTSPCFAADIWGISGTPDTTVNMWDLSKVLGNWKQDNLTVDIWGQEGESDGDINMWDVSKILGCWKK